MSADQGDAIGHANLGYLLAATGHIELARQEYQTALAMRPDLALARRALAQLDRQERGIALAAATAIAHKVTPPPAAIGHARRPGHPDVGADPAVPRPRP